MKPCSYCAEENQEEAVICHACGRDLQSTKTAETNNEREAVTPFRPQAWKQGALAAAVLTILTAAASFADASNSMELMRDLVLGTPINFLFFWLVCTFIVWAWRQASRPSFSSNDQGTLKNQ